MPIWEDENTPVSKLQDIRKRNVCAVCGEWLNVFLDRDSGLAFVACHDWFRTHHEGIEREASPYEQKGFESLNFETRRKIMTQQHGEGMTKALDKYVGVTSLTREQAEEILLTVFPGAPRAEMERAVMLCASYNLNPLMGHVFLIPFKGKEGKVTYATVMGIRAKRLLASRRHPFSYINDSPRLMTEAEQTKIFGKVDANHICAITILKDPKTQAEARGYGKWPKSDTPYGTDKGNSAENMAFIRSESQALDRLCPGEMPFGVEIIDESYAPKEEEKVAQAPEPGVIEEEAKEVKEGEAESEPPFPEEPEGKTEPESEQKPAKPAPARASAPRKVAPTVENLKKVLKDRGWTAQDAGHYCINVKYWKIRNYEDLTKEQIAELIEYIQQNPPPKRE